MRAVLLVLLLALGCAGAVKIQTPYLSLSSVDAAVRVMDMAETVWLDVGAGAGYPVDSHSDPGRVTLTVANVSCTSRMERVVCALPPTGHLASSGRLYQNDTTMTLGSDAYRVTMTATLEGAVWEADNVWRGTTPVLMVEVYEQSPKERSERVAKGALCFLVTLPVLLLAEMVVVWLDI